MAELTFKDVLPYMTCRHCFGRVTVAAAIAKIYDEKNMLQFLNLASKILVNARNKNEIRFLHGRDRSCYYELIKESTNNE